MTDRRRRLRTNALKMAAVDFYGAIQRYVLSSVSIALLGALPGGEVFAEGLSGDAELLRLAAVEQQENLEMLRTWSSNVTIDKEVKSGDVIVVKTSAILEFVYDKASGVHWTWIDVNHKRNADVGKDRTAAGSTGLTLPKQGATYYRPALPSEDLTEGQIVGVYPSPGNPAVRPGINADNFDPTYFYRIGEQDINKRFLFYYAAWEKDADLKHVSIERKASQITLEIRDPTLLNRYVVDLAVSGNVVEYVGEENSSVLVASDAWKYEYEEVGGVWIPKLITMKNTNAGGFQTTVVTRLLKTDVNGRTPAEKFNVEAVGIRPGELVQDTRTNANYTFGGPASPERAQASRGSWLWLANLAVLAVVALYVLVRWRRTR